jgi:hypothetical protein
MMIMTTGTISVKADQDQDAQATGVIQGVAIPGGILLMITVVQIPADVQVQAVRIQEDQAPAVQIHVQVPAAQIPAGQVTDAAVLAEAEVHLQAVLHPVLPVAGAAIQAAAVVDQVAAAADQVAAMEIAAHQVAPVLARMLLHPGLHHRAVNQAAEVQQAHAVAQVHLQVAVKKVQEQKKAAGKK